MNKPFITLELLEQDAAGAQERWYYTAMAEAVERQYKLAELDELERQENEMWKGEIGYVPLYTLLPSNLATTLRTECELNGEHLDLRECSEGGPDSGNMDHCCMHCGQYYHVPLY